MCLDEIASSYKVRKYNMGEGKPQKNSFFRYLFNKFREETPINILLRFFFHAIIRVFLVFGPVKPTLST